MQKNKLYFALIKKIFVTLQPEWRKWTYIKLTC